MANEKMNKDTIPDFCFKMVLVDAIPVVLFGINSILISILLKNYIMLAGGAICLISGTIKVLWKGIVSLKHKNVWWMFIQMRIAMPIGFLLMIIALFFYKTYEAFWFGFLQMPNFIFHILGFLGMIAMSFCAFILDSSDPKSNWIEQTINSLSQFFIFIGVILYFVIFCFPIFK